MQRQRAFDRLSGLDARLDVQITDQIGKGSFKGEVGGVMQFHTIGEMLLPAEGADGVKHGGKLTAGLGKQLSLCRWGFEP